MCNKTAKRENSANFARTSSGNTKDKVTSDALKSICEDKGVNVGSSSTIKLATGGSKPLPVGIGKNPSVKKPMFTADSLKRLQNSMNLSNRQTL